MAHEHQLSDITETCKKEADLLDCLRGSKLEFDEYLKQVDEMLSRKVSSIKDLQSQITRLRSYPAANELITEIDVKQSTTATATINS